MISYNGVDIRSVAPVRIEDIRVSPIAFSPVARPRAIAGGSEFVRTQDGTRTVTVTFAILEDSPVSRAHHLAAIRQWANTARESRLELADMPGKYLEAVCTAHPEPSTRQWWESKLRLTFTCFNNPYWTDIAERHSACGTAFFVNGDAPPLMRIACIRETAASNQAYSNGTETMSFSTIPAGGMTIDLNRQTADVDGTSIMQYYAFTSSFLVPRTGSQNITGSGFVAWRERWL